MQDLLTTGEVARLLGVTIPTVVDYEKKGLVPDMRFFNGRRRYKLTTVKDFLVKASDEQTAKEVIRNYRENNHSNS